MYTRRRCQYSRLERHRDVAEDEQNEQADHDGQADQHHELLLNRESHIGFKGTNHLAAHSSP